MKRWIVPLAPLIAILTLIGWRLQQNQAAVAAQAKQREARTKSAPVVSAVMAETRDIVHNFSGVGTIEAPLDVKLAAKVTGRIESLTVQPGDHVTAGQVLVQIDPTELRAQVRQRQAALNSAEFKLAQARITEGPTNVGINTQISQQEAAVSSADANYNQVRANYQQQVAAAEAAVSDAHSRVANADAAIANANAVIGSATANVSNAKSQYRRTHDLFSQGYIPAQDVDTADTAVKVQEGSLNVANAQLNSAKAAYNSALAQERSSRNQAQIVKTKGLSDIAAARAQLNQAQAALRYARANTAQTPAYRENLAALEADVESARASLADTQSLLNDTSITSPMEGFVTSRSMDPGDVANAGSPILSVRFLRSVWVSVPVPEEVSHKIHLGQTATIRLDSIPGRVFTGHVTQLPPSADPVTRQFPVRITLDNSQGLIKPGMFARVSMEVDRVRNATVVPPEAIQQGKGGPTVLLVDSASKVHHRPVVTGARDAAGIAILQGVQPGEQVVTLSAMPLKEDQVVKVASAKPGVVLKESMERPQ